jgi:hypothetical protein
MDQHVLTAWVLGAAMGALMPFVRLRSHLGDLALGGRAQACDELEQLCAASVVT